MAKKDFNVQTNKERGNAAQYDAFADDLELSGWWGFAKWMRKAAHDERKHYQLFSRHMTARGWAVTSTALAAPQSLNGDAPLPLFEAALALEEENTTSINDLYAVTEREADVQGMAFLMSWAIEEQTKSVKDLKDRVKDLRSAADDFDALLRLDERYGKE